MEKENKEQYNALYKMLCGVNSQLTEGLLFWISQFCGSKGFLHTDNGMELKWYLKEEAEKLYEGVDDKKLPLYTTKEIMVKYYSYTT